MRIIGLIDEHSGPAYHRIKLPLLLMDGPDCHLTNVLREEELQKGCDLLYISRYAQHNKLQQVLDWKNDYEFKLVVDVDDYWILDTHHILYERWKENNIPQLFIDYIKASDAVTTTHERLREKILPYNSNVEIFPNAIPLGYEQFNINKTQCDKVRFFWQGSQTHRRDIELLRNPLKRCSDLNILMVLAGYSKGYADWDEMASAYTNSLRLNGAILPGTNVNEYYKNYEYCDVALIPLLDTTFNNMKSNLKILEAAAAGAPVIVSKVNPYLNFEGVNYVTSQQDWYKFIKMYAKNKGMMYEQGEALFYYCNEHYNFYKINELRKEFICSSEILIF
jgi:glycosyltransferase involved in cell wall biosynthesis